MNTKNIITFSALTLLLSASIVSIIKNIKQKKRIKKIEANQNKIIEHIDNSLKEKEVVTELVKELTKKKDTKKDSK